MRNPIPFKVTDENRKFYNITQGAYVFGLCSHATGTFGFWLLGMPEMVLFNVVVSLPSFVFAIVVNRLGRHSLAFGFAFFELLVHQVVGVYYTGWDFGLQYWLIFLAVLCFFNPKWNRQFQFLLLIVVSSAFVGSFIFFSEGVYDLEPAVLEFGAVSSGVFVIAVLSLLVSYYSRSTHRAERKLQEEKARTEQQNEQLIQQHDTLVIEQDKTYKLLNKIQALFGQQVSEEVAQELIQSESEVDSKVYDVTIMFLDIRDFSVFADSREPSEVAQFQNIVFGELIEIVRVHHGIVLQILGDGIMAVFGAPVLDKKHRENAVKAGYQMIETVQALGEGGRIPPVRIGIGLNSGTVIAGNVGNEARRFYSLTGKNVIIAARVEQLNKKYDSQMLITESVFNGSRRDDQSVEDLGEVQLKGIEKSVGVYRLA